MRRFGILLAASWLAVSTLSAADSPVRRAPGFSLPDSSMQQHDLYDYRGKVVLIELMKTNCGQCQVLTGTLEKLRTKYGNKVQILSVVTPPDTLREVSPFITRFGVKYPILFDSGQMAASYVRITPANPKPVHLPTLYVVDPNGMIRQELVYEDATKAQFEEGALSSFIDQALAAGGKK